MALYEQKRTTFSTQDYADAVHTADSSLTREQAGVLWAQYAIETGQGQSCWNCNIGNVKVTPAQVAAGVDYFMLKGTWEIINGKRVVFDPPHVQTWFRHFRSLPEAMVHHLSFLQRRFAKAWASVLTGDPEAFAYRLKELKYYTGPEDVYARSMSYFHSVWMRTVDYAGVIELDTVGTLPMGGIIHNTHIVDWALKQRELEREAELNAMLGGFGRYDEDAA